MSLENIYYIGQTIAVAAVLGSLIFVGVQVRLSTEQMKQSNNLARADMSERIISGYADSLREISSNRELAGAFRKVMFDHDELSPVEQTQILTYFNLTMMNFRAAYIASIEGLVETSQLESILKNALWYLTAPVFAREWRRLQKTKLFEGEFVDYVNEQFARQYPEADLAEIHSPL